MKPDEENENEAPDSSTKSENSEPKKSRAEKAKELAAEKLAGEKAAAEKAKAEKAEKAEKAKAEKKDGKQPKENGEIVENGDEAELETKKKEEENKKKKEKKPVKKSIPNWASLSEAEMQRMTQKGGHRKLEKPKFDGIIVEAMEACKDNKGTASVISLKNFVNKKYPQYPKSVFKKALKRAIEKNLIKQVKGTGCSGSFKLLPQPKIKPKDKKSKKEVERIPLDDLMPYIFTWVCDPKEASAGLIKKYIEKNFPKLNADSKAFKKALEHGVAKGQLEQITGKGASGTFQLVDGAKKTGTRYEDAIEDAIIAMNEPKDASVIALRNYLCEYNTEYGVAQRPHVLKNCLERLESKGHVIRISGKGFSGTFRLAYPYHPTPRELWRDDYESEDEDDKKPVSKKRKMVQESEDESEESEDEEEEEEAPPPKKVRGAPKPRSIPIKKPKITARKPPAAKQPKKKAAPPKSKKTPMTPVIIAKKSKPPTAPPIAKRASRSRRK